MDDLYDSCDEASSGSEASMFGDEQYLEHSTDAAAPRTAGPLGYSVLTPDRLHSFQDKALADVAGVLACSVGIARTLLIYFRWNVENLFGMSMPDGEPDQSPEATRLRLTLKCTMPYSLSGRS